MDTINFTGSTKGKISKPRTHTTTRLKLKAFGDNTPNNNSLQLQPHRIGSKLKNKTTLTLESKYSIWELTWEKKGPSSVSEVAEKKLGLATTPPRREIFIFRFQTQIGSFGERRQRNEGRNRIVLAYIFYFVGHL